MKPRAPSALRLPASLALGALAGCGPSATGADSGPEASLDGTAAVDSSAEACADPNRLPSGSDFGCWMCPPPPTAATMYLGQPEGARCSVCTPDPAITLRPRGDCYACTPGDGGAAIGFC